MNTMFYVNYVLKIFDLNSPCFKFTSLHACIYLQAKTVIEKYLGTLCFCMK